MPKVAPKVLLNNKFPKLTPLPTHPAIEKNNHSIHLEISVVAYDPPKKRPESIELYTYVPAMSNDFFCIYVSATDKTVIIGIRGTVPTNPFDLFNDLIISFRGGCEYPRVAFAKAILVAVKRKYPLYKYHVTGHSLGGGVARCLSIDDTSVISVSFNPAAPPTKLATTAGSNSTSYHIVFDLISAWMGGGSEVSYRIDTDLRPDQNLINSLGRAHDLSQFRQTGAKVISAEAENKLWQEWYHKVAPKWFVAIYQSVREGKTMTPVFIIRAQFNKSLEAIPGSTSSPPILATNALDESPVGQVLPEGVLPLAV